MKKELILIAGPCVIESEKMIMHLAEKLKRITEDLPIEYYFKASFDKANRTSISSYRGPGIEEGLRILEKVKFDYSLKIATDIHEPFQADLVKDVADIIQIPAFLCRQTDLLVAAAKSQGGYPFIFLIIHFNCKSQGLNRSIFVLPKSHYRYGCIAGGNVIRIHQFIISSLL